MIDRQNSRNIQVGVTVLGCIADNKIDNNPMVGMTVAVAVAIEEACK